MSGFDNQLWKCSNCEDKDKDIKSVLQSIQSLHSEMKTMKAEHQTERERVLEGLKSMENVAENVAKRLDTIETTQVTQAAKLENHDKVISLQAEKIEDNSSKLVVLEEQVRKIDTEALSIRQTNAVVREIREIEKRERNVIICNVPESTEETSEGRKRVDEEKVAGILTELESEEIRPVNVIRVGTKGRYPRKILLILGSTDECEKILKKAELVELANTVYVTRDRTFNQRAEARQYRLEREKEEKEGKVSRGRGRGRGRGAGRPSRGQGSLRGRGSSSRGLPRKRRLSQEDDESKRRRTEEKEEMQTLKDNSSDTLDIGSKVPSASPQRSSSSNGSSSGGNNNNNSKRPSTPIPGRSSMSASAPKPPHCDLNY